jgi:flap endonuclease-1
MIRRLHSSKASEPVLEVDYAVATRGLGLTHEQFVDLCILCGCDYTDR